MKLSQVDGDRLQKQIDELEQKRLAQSASAPTNSIH